ncbi:dihydrofolate reductase family protein [Ligilactobacillus sp. WC1T17]|uniref:dihydrofolate reductase family protein n=1 Tax=Ligilactobacillus sp. WC1T17 TaxID=3158786 RepID=UPI001CDACD4F
MVDTKGTLLWKKETSSQKPHLIILSKQVTTEYLKYLDEQNIFWIVTGDKHINLAKAMQILAEHFHVNRMGVVGGPTINTAFLEAKLLDEFAMLIGPGIDGRKEMPSVFEGRKDNPPLH